VSDLGKPKLLKNAPRAKQMRGMPDYPVLPLEMLAASESAEWSIDDLGLCRGIGITGRSRLTFAPHPLPKMAMRRLMVVCEYRAIDEDASFQMQLYYVTNGNKPLGLQTDKDVPVVCAANTKSRWGFELDLSAMQQTDVLSCSLEFIPVKMKGLLISSTWIQIED